MTTMPTRFSPNSGNFESLLLAGPYHIPEQQRNFEWSAEESLCFITDPGKIFLGEYTTGDSLQKIRLYSHYSFNNMSIDMTNGKKEVTDGYQRVIQSVVTAIVATQKLNRTVSWIENLIRSDDYGQIVFNIQTNDTEFNYVLEEIYHGHTVDTSSLTSTSAINLYAAYVNTKKLWPAELDGDNLLPFINFLYRNSYLTWTESSNADVHTLFESANARGRRLNDYSLFRNHVMSKIDDPEEKAKAGEALRKVSDRLDREMSVKKTIIPTDEFLTDIFRAEHATGAKIESSAGMPQDWDEMNKPFAWGSKNFEKLTDDPYTYATKVLPLKVSLYIEINKASKNEIAGLEEVLHATYMKTPWLNIMLMSVVNPDFSLNKNLKHINIMANFLATYIARRTFKGVNTIGGGIKPTLVNIIKQVRGLDTHNLVLTLNAILEHESTAKFDDSPVKYDKIKNQSNMRRLNVMFANVENMLRKANKQPSLFAAQVKAIGANSCSMDHIIAQSTFKNHETKWNVNEDTFNSIVNMLGNLALATQSANSGWKNAPLSDKLIDLGKHSLMGATLNKEMLDSDGRVKNGTSSGLRNFLDRLSIRLPVVDANDFGATEIYERTTITIQLIKEAYSNSILFSLSGMTKEEAEELAGEELDSIAAGYSVEEETTPKNKGNKDYSTLSNRTRKLVQEGKLKPGTILKTMKFPTVHAKLNFDGTIQIDEEKFHSLTGAANHVIRNSGQEDIVKCKDGWNFWSAEVEEELIPLIKIRD